MRTIFRTVLATAVAKIGLMALSMVPSVVGERAAGVAEHRRFVRQGLTEGHVAVHADHRLVPQVLALRHKIRLAGRSSGSRMNKAARDPRSSGNKPWLHRLGPKISNAFSPGIV
jgi:hypothetical protein